MAVVVVDKFRVELNAGESLLDAFLREGIDHPHGCKAGVCQSCLIQVTEGSIPSKAQNSLTPAQQELGYALACQCEPVDDLVVVTECDSRKKLPAEVVSLDRLNADVVRLRLKSDMVFRAGQYLSLWNASGESRCYSIANIPDASGTLELHIKLLSGGVFSDWLGNGLNPGDSVQISGPMGQCIYTAEPEQPLLLAGIGTGLAPLCGILEDALAAQHCGSIHLVAAAKNSSQLYYVQKLQRLAQQHQNLTVDFLTQTFDSEPVEGVQEGDVYAFVKEKHPSTKNYRAFLCGAGSFVTKLKKQIFLAGADMKAISADVFLPSG